MDSAIAKAPGIETTQQDELHDSGVHVECRPAHGRPDGTWRHCTLAGKVERFHSHDYQGPLVCGCNEFGA